VELPGLRLLSIGLCIGPPLRRQSGGVVEYHVTMTMDLKASPRTSRVVTIDPIRCADLHLYGLVGSHDALKKVLLLANSIGPCARTSMGNPLRLFGTTSSWSFALQYVYVALVHAGQVAACQR